MPTNLQESIKAILGTAGRTRRDLNQVCSRYGVLTNGLKSRVVGWYGHNKEAYLADIIAVHLMIHWLDQRLERIEKDVARIAQNDPRSADEAVEHAEQHVE